MSDDVLKKIKRRQIDGVLLLDKPIGLSSQQALSRAKYMLQALKAGHTGTLDPLATGLLPLCFGEATKFAQGLLDADKTYLATLRLGLTTTTGDGEGEVLSTLPVACTEQQIQDLPNHFVGEHWQVPPMYSALKYQGKPLYEYARQGIVIDRPARLIHIDAFQIMSIQLPDFTFRVKCSKGTYVRTLAEEIGQFFGCGAHLRALRRIQVGDLSIDDAYTLMQLECMTPAEREHTLYPVDQLLTTLPKIDLDSFVLKQHFMNGQRIALGDLSDWRMPDEVTYLRVYYHQDFLGLAKCGQGVLAPYRLLAV